MCVNSIRWISGDYSSQKPINGSENLHQAASSKMSALFGCAYLWELAFLDMHDMICISKFKARLTDEHSITP